MALDCLVFTITVVIISVFDIISMRKTIAKENKQNGMYASNSIGVGGYMTPEPLDLTSIKIFNKDEMLETSRTLYTEKTFDLEIQSSTRQGIQEPEAENLTSVKSKESLVNEIEYENENVLTEENNFGQHLETIDEEIVYGHGNGEGNWTMSFENQSEVDAGVITQFNKPKELPPPPNILETILEESILEVSRAQIFDNDPDFINIQHIPSGRNLLIKKSFDGAEIIDPTENNDSIIDSEFYSVESVNPYDVRYGTLKNKENNKLVSAKRDLAGATVVDIQEKDGRWLIGKYISREEDFDFNNAIEDPTNTENVLVTHKKTGVKCRVKKSFKGLPRLDKKTNLPMFREKLIGPYDLSSVVIDQRNLHFANLIQDGKEIRARRNFIGGKIMDVMSEDEYQALKAELANKKNKKEELKDLNKQITKANLNREESIEAIILQEGRNLEISDPALFVFNKDNYEEEAPNISKTSSKLFTETFISNSSKQSKAPDGISSLEAIYLQRLEPARTMSVAPKRKKKTKKMQYNPFMNPTTEDSILNQLEDSILNQLNLRGDPTDLDFELIRRKTDNV